MAVALLLEIISSEVGLLNTSQPTLKPPFIGETASATIQVLQDLWNSRDADQIVTTFDGEATVLNRGNVIEGCRSIRTYLERRLSKALHCTMTMDLWSFSESRISASFMSEWQDAIRGQWYRTEGNMQMCFTEQGLIEKLSVSAADARIPVNERAIGNPTVKRPILGQPIIETNGEKP